MEWCHVWALSEEPMDLLKLLVSVQLAHIPCGQLGSKFCVKYVH